MRVCLAERADDARAQCIRKAETVGSALIDGSKLQHVAEDDYSAGAVGFIQDTWRSISALEIGPFLFAALFVKPNTASHSLILAGYSFRLVPLAGRQAKSDVSYITRVHTIL